MVIFTLMLCKIDLTESESSGHFIMYIFKKNLIMYFWLHWVFVAARGLFSSCGERGLFFAAVHELLITVASLVAEHGL